MGWRLTHKESCRISLVSEQRPISQIRCLGKNSALFLAGLDEAAVGVCVVRSLFSLSEDSELCSATIARRERGAGVTNRR